MANTDEFKGAYSDIDILRGYILNKQAVHDDFVDALSRVLDAYESVIDERMDGTNNLFSKF